MTAPPSTAREPDPLPLWPLAAWAGTLPLVATLLAWALAVHEGRVPACNPFFDGCTSISRTAREGLANPVFRALMLPAATLQALVWWLTARWLRHALQGQGLPLRGLPAVAPLGLLAALALVAYATFLGIEGPIYRALRQYGTVVYFGFTCLCLLWTGAALQRLAAAGRVALSRPLAGTMGALAVTLVALGLANALVAAFIGDPWKGRIENVTEWWGALIFVLGFWALARVWRRLGLVLRWQESGATPG